MRLKKGKLKCVFKGNIVS